MTRVMHICACLLLLTAGGSSTNSRDDVREKERKTHGWLGVSIQDITSKIAKQKGLKSRDGVYLSEVAEDSPAEAAGLEKGDVVVEFSGKPILDSEELTESVRGTTPGSKVSIVVVRKGERKTIQATIGKLPKSHAFAFAVPRIKSPVIRLFREVRSLGLNLRQLNPQLAEYFGVPEGEGVLVEEVESKSAGEKAGFKAGDVILKIGKRSINDVGDVARAVELYEDEGKVDAEILRKGAKKNLSIELEKSDDDEEDSAWFHSSPGGAGFHSFKFEIPEIEVGAPSRPRMRIEKELHDFRELNHLRRFRTLPDFPGYHKGI